MGSIQSKAFLKVMTFVGMIMLGAAIVSYGQDPTATPAPASDQPPATSPAPPADSPSGWHKFSHPSAAPNSPAANPAQTDPAPAEEPSAAIPPSDPPPQAPPAKITIPAGTFVTVRVDQFLSSDKNVAGDGFSATLSRALVADGVVVARRGQTVGGQVTEAQKAGRVKGVSRLGLQLTTLTLADGQQVPIETSPDDMKGPTSKGRDATAMAMTTGSGAAIGAAAGGGVGAGIGAGAGLVVSTVGVLVTRGRPTVVYPESPLTFRLARAITISTARAPRAFVAVNTPGADQPSRPQGPPPSYRSACDGCPPPPYSYPPAYYPYYWGPAFSFWYGPRFYGGPVFYGRPFGFRP